MLLRSGLLVGLVLALAQQSEAPAPGELAAPPLRQRLRSLGGEIAKAGEIEPLERLRTVLVGLGDDEKHLERVERDWERIALGAKATRSTRTAAASKLRRELEPLVEQLAAEAEPRRSALARWILELDLAEPSANAVLGRERDTDGEWLTPAERALKGGARRVEGLLRDAARIDVQIGQGVSANAALLELSGGGNIVRSHGIELHSRLPAEKLERILRQALRAASLSRALVLDRLELPDKKPHAFVLLDASADLGPALEQARAAHGLSDEEYRVTVDLHLRSFEDARGWRTCSWRSEADFEALVLWEILGDWIRDEAQACLRVGHLNWVCLAFLGTSIPMTAWSEDQTTSSTDQRTSARPAAAVGRDKLWRCARQSLWGTRAWMIGQVREQRDPPWARAMLDQDGKIRDANLLKTTLVCELLQQQGRLGELLAATRGKGEPVSLFEKALGESLPDFEQEWRRWLDPPRRAGIAQLLEGAPAPAEGAESPFAAALLALNQARADALKDQHPEIPIVALDSDLSRAAESHARYLTLNPEQRSRWPAVHEEYAGAPGFTPEGVLAGAHAVIAFGGDPLASVREWLGSFYHRLPLLDPGLFGVGFGRCDDVIVLDAGSLRVEPWSDHVVVWPLPDAVNVPRSNVPEMPSPVPGVDLSGLGYPISVQLFFVDQRRELELELALFRGDVGDDARVDAYLVSPAAPLQPELVPENAWGLIPKAPLAKKTRYTARAAWAGQTKTWSFTTGE